MFKIACIKDKAPLYDDEVFGIECYTELEINDNDPAYNVAMVFMFRNRTKSILEDFEVTYKSTPGKLK